MPDSAASASKPNLLQRVIAWALSLRAVRAFLHYSEHRGPMLADSITYRTLFSVFAGVLLGFSIAGLWLSGTPGAMDALVKAVDSAIPGLVGEGGIVKLEDLQVPAGLTIAGILSLIGLVGAAIGAIGSLRTALRIIGDRIHDDVLWIWVLLRNLLLAIAVGGGFVAAAAVSFVGTAFIDAVTRWLGFSGDTGWLTWGFSLLIVLALDTCLVALVFATLSGIKPPAKTLWGGAVIAGVGLLVLQQLSGLFVGGASSNPLLASFASLIALLLWLNLSSQVILIAASWMVVGTEEQSDRIRARHGAATFAQRRVRKAEDAVRLATEELQNARRDEEKERADA